MGRKTEYTDKDLKQVVKEFKKKNHNKTTSSDEVRKEEIG